MGTFLLNFITESQKLLLLLLLLLFNCKLGVTRWQWHYNETQHKNNTHHTKQHNTLKQNTANKTTQTIKDTLHTMNTMQIQLQLQLHKLILYRICSKTFPGNSSVNTNTGNNRKETVYYAVRTGRAHGSVRSLLPGSEAINKHPQH
jgi:hypothetical protein